MKTEYYFPSEISLLVAKTNFKLVSIIEIEEDGDVFYEFNLVNQDGSKRIKVKYAKEIGMINFDRKNYKPRTMSRLVSINVSKDTVDENVSFELKNENYKRNRDIVSTILNVLKGIQ